MLIFDCETGALDESLIRELSPPYEPPQHPGEFDPASVKYGNVKDQTKRDAKLAEQKAAHEKAVAEYEQACKDGEAAYWQKVIEDAALSPVTGRVLAIGMLNASSGKAGIAHNDADEATLIANFWQKFSAAKVNNLKFAGWNIHGFDLPFLYRRSWILGVDVPADVFDGRYWNRLFVDLQSTWQLGQRWQAGESKLDYVGKALGLNGKATNGVAGATFAKYWRGTPEERAKAQEYLLRDLELTALVASRLGVA